MAAYRNFIFLTTAPIPLQHYHLTFDRRAFRNTYLRPFPWIAAGLLGGIILVIYYPLSMDVGMNFPLMLLFLALLGCLLTGLRDLYRAIHWYVEVRRLADGHLQGTTAVLTLTDQTFTWDMDDVSTSERLAELNTLTVSEHGVIAQFPGSAFVLPAPCLGDGNYSQPVRQLKQRMRTEQSQPLKFPHAEEE